MENHGLGWDSLVAPKDGGGALGNVLVLTKVSIDSLPK
jgi:hypothetical protein